MGLAAVVLKITSIVVMIMIRASINSAGSFQGLEMLSRQMVL